ncbi:CaiB/BaiF CoA-transferase family protein [Sulfitobacter sp. F26169L]|uniref:CaiB/BaiF CoA transferase family protein n=1 Tax=Sulfitobacter sp. F26169L TaxID=2996015 RepID=UPI002260F783|nr:CaiB/BaiF CoA-transferase family protein [Sulfitobacter sp. F26169L]MCX7567929.1 CaiB/BaiF CoA-transferase family protein [Sulfitobacter sp. F26169L]
MSGPLKGMQVVEMVGLGPAPLAGQLLADLGADVIVIDRAHAPADKTDVNRRGKRSVVLDLKTEEGRQAARALINASGIVIEGFRPGVMERLGLGPDDLDDHVILGRITGWGQTGPLSKFAGHDINYLGLTGALAAMGTANAPPPPPLNLVADYGGGTMFLLLGIMAAVYERHTSGKGQVVDAAMVDGVSAMMGLIHTFLARDQWSSFRQNNVLDGGAPFYRCYRTSDNLFMTVGSIEPQFHALLLEKAGLPAEHGASQFDQTSWHARSAQYEEVFAARTQAEWVEIFEGTDACVAPVLAFENVASHPHMASREVMIDVNGVSQAAPAPRFSRSVPEPVKSPAAVGGDTEEILASLKASSGG